MLRDLWRTRGQALAIAVVIGCGIAVFTMMNGALRSLEVTRDAYYERYRFADAWAPVKRAPEFRMNQIRRIPGVQTAESRIQRMVLVDAEGVPEPITGIILSYPDHGEPLINALHMVAGRIPDTGQPDEVLLLSAFAQARDLQPGDRLSANMNGVRKTLDIVGLVKSPEYVYGIPPGELVPDKARFAVMWMGRRAMASAFDLEGAFNEVQLKASRGALMPEILAQLDRELDRYGTTGAYSRDDQLSDEFVRSEIEQLSTIRWIIPPVFLLVAAFLLNVVTTRLVETEREQIGLMRAFGYNSWDIGLHYLKFVLVVAGTGTIGGLAVGTWMGRGLAELYQEYFDFPLLLFQPSTSVYALSVVIALISASAGALGAVNKAIRLEPAIAMRPPAPADYKAFGSARIKSLVHDYLDQPSRMIIRHITRYPQRASITCLGIALAVAIRIMAGSMPVSTNEMISVNYDYIERQQLSVSFSERTAIGVMHELASLPGVMLAEPSRVVPAKLINGHKWRRYSIVGIDSNPQLHRLIDANKQPVEIPEEGILLAEKMAEILGVGPGDEITLEIMEGRRPKVQVRVSGLIQSYIGTPVYMNINALNRLLKEGPSITGAYLMVDKAKADNLYQKLKNTPRASGVTMQDEAEHTFRQMMDESIGVMNVINTLFASLIAIGVVYNSARISLSERARELASLRVMGLTRGEVSYILLGELTLITLAALPLGMLLGTGLVIFVIGQFDSELFQMPLVFAASAYGNAALVVVIAAIVSALLVRRRIDSFDLVEVLKTRE